MSIEIRKVRGHGYVTRTYRVANGIRKAHLGTTGDPNARYLFRRYRLWKAEQRMAFENATQEIERGDEINPLMRVLDQSRKYWSVLQKFFLPQTFEEMIVPDEPPDVAKLSIELEKLPAPKRMNELCRLADEGSESARRIVNRLFRQADGLSRSLFNVTKVARELVESELAGDSYAVRKAIKEQMDERIAELTHCKTTDSNPLREMYCEMLAVAWLDSLKSTLAASRGSTTASLQKKLDSQADRACRRYSRLASAFSKLK